MTRSLLRHAADDLRAALASGPYRLFLLAWLVAAAYIVVRRGPAMAPSLAVLGAGLVFFGGLAWLAARSPRARSTPDRVAWPRAEAAAVAVAWLGVACLSFGVAGAGTALVAAGAAGWVAAVVRAGPRPSDAAWLRRGWLPHVPLLLGIAAPKALMLGLDLVPRTLGALPSGLVQQVLLQIAVTARVEAIAGRRDVAAVVAAVAFGVVHVPLDLEAAGGDWSLAWANAIVLQAAIGLVACGAYLRHRAPLAIGAGHALLMA